MGVMYWAEPLTVKVAEGLRGFLSDLPLNHGRPPTPADLRGALAELPRRYTFQYRMAETPRPGDDWSIEVTRRDRPPRRQAVGRKMTVTRYSGSYAWFRVEGYQAEDRPVRIEEIHGTFNVMLGVLRLIARRTGPLLFDGEGDCGALPLIVHAGADLRTLIRAVAEGGDEDME